MKILLGFRLKNWIGKWVMFVASGHMAVAFFLFIHAYRELIADGMFNSVKSDKSGFAVWFVLFGIVLFIVGMLIATIEKQGLEIPKSIGVALSLLTIVGVILMPVSGFWLMFPALFSVFFFRNPQILASDEV